MNAIEARLLENVDLLTLDTSRVNPLSDCPAIQVGRATVPASGQDTLRTSPASLSLAISSKMGVTLYVPFPLCRCGVQT